MSHDHPKAASVEPPDGCVSFHVPLHYSFCRHGRHRAEGHPAAGPAGTSARHALLRTDAGVFPAPIVVDETGVLTMDLGGSTTYTLSCINSTVPIPDPSAEQTPDTQQSSEEVQQPQEQNAATEPNSGIPIVPLVVFLVGSWSALPAGAAAWWRSTLPSGAAKRLIMTSGRTRTTSSIERKKRPQTEMGSPRLKTAKKLMKLPRKCGFLLTISRYFVIIPL